MKLFLLNALAPGLLLLSCGTSSTEPASGQPQSDTLALQQDTVMSSDTVIVYFPASYVTSDTTVRADLLFQGSYHADEVEERWIDLEWKGIFKGQSGYYIADAQLEFTRENDPLLDEDESQATGWGVRSRMKDESVCFIRMDGLTDTKVMQIVPAKSQIYPGDSVEISWGKTKGYLVASGMTYPDPYLSGNSWVDNYKLFLTAEKDGKKVTQLLIEHENFDDQMTSILFIGDIDQDGYADFLIDASRHYNSFAPTLFLSSGSDANHLLEIVAWHWSNGC